MPHAAAHPVELPRSEGIKLSVRGNMSGKRSRKNGRDAFGFILSFVKRHIPAIAAGVLVLMSVDLIQIIIPRIIQRTIDALGGASFTQDLVLRNSLFILGLAVSMVVLRFLWRIFIMGTARRIEKEVREDMFSHLQRLGFSYFNRTQTGHLMALMINDVDAVRMATGPSFLALTDALFMGTLSLIFLLSISVRLTLFAVMPLPFIIFMITRYGPLIQTRFKAVQESFGRISAQTQEAFTGIRVVKGYAQEHHEIHNFEKKCGDYVGKNLQLIRIWGFFFPAVTLMANLSMAILYLTGGRAVVLGRLSFGEFVSFSMYLGLLIWPVIAIGWVFMIFQRGMASSKRILELMSTKSDVFDAPDVSRESINIRGDIRIDNLRFSYNGKPVLHGIDLDLPAGTSLGIMGKPGSGKSTLIYLLLRLFTVHEGTITVDGVNIADIPLPLLRGAMGYVPQDPFLFSDTIRNNIAFGLDEKTRDAGEIIKYARMAALYDEIAAFGSGFDTLVGERGVTLSGGQKQRLSIARALIVRPKILILDDALSSVDALAEREILTGVREEMRGRTTIIISHRVSTVKDCDHIVVLENGSIREQGSHGELTRFDGYYNRLYELQRLEGILQD
jgi:ATP-binding cassette subfamily B multidrug efflux pump